MSTLPKRWNVLKPITPEERAVYRDLNPVLAQVLYNRGIQDYETALAFVSRAEVLHNPMQMKGMSVALARIRQAIRHKEPVVVYGDFDADGVTSTVLMVQTLEALGANVKPYIPHRVDEGYGLNTPALQQIAADGCKLVITVDCGVRSVEEVKAGNEAGLDIIITDHHSIGDEIPPALAVLNPKQSDCPYPEEMLAGVGIAFKLADALLRAETANGRNAPSITTQDLLDLVALGTVADLAPLDRLENRTLVQMGLRELNRARRPGIYALLNVAQIEPGAVGAMSIGFGLGPRINAAGRLGSALKAYDLLYTDNFDEATRLAEELQELNIERQELTQIAQEQARELAEAEDGADAPLIFAAHKEFRSGIVGLVAGRLVEEYYRPAVVVEIGEEGESRGSCRSIPEFNITEALDACTDLLLRHGGHAQAAGFTIKNENLSAFKERLMQIVREKRQQASTEPSVTIDASITLSQVTLELAQDLQKLEPTGQSNDLPLFTCGRLKVIDARTVGKDDSHLKLRLGDGPLNVDAIAFRQGEWLQRMPPYVDVVFHLEVNEWKGYVKPQLNIRDLKPAGS